MRNASVPAGALVALALIAVPTPRFELQAQEAVSLEDAVALALARSPSYVQAEVSVESAQEDRRTAVGAFLPTLSLSTGASMRPGSVFDPTTQSQLDVTNRSLSGGVNVGMDLFSGGRNRAELSRADVEIEAADAALEGERFQLILQTKQLFFGALEQADLLGVAEARVARAEESLAIAVRQLAVGAATSSDSLRAQLELANARQAALQSEAQLRAARVALGRHVGVAGPVEALRPEDLEPSPLPLSDGEIFALAEGSSPGVRSASLNADASGASLTSARAAYYPTARISSGYNWSNDAWDVSGGQGRWSGLSLSLSYSVFNGFSREASVARAEDQVRVSRLQAEDARLQARQEADAALFALRTSEEAVRIAEEAARVAEEDLRVVRERYEVGVATLFEVVTSQLALDEAETSRVSTRYDYLIARAELEAILGREL
jgi:outer membrane protein TolC